MYGPRSCERKLTNSSCSFVVPASLLSISTRLLGVAFCSCQGLKYQSKLANHGSPSQLSHRAVKPDASVGRSAGVLELLTAVPARGVVLQLNPSVTSHRHSPYEAVS